MITARPQKNLSQAKTYFREHLAHGDYYSESQTVRGVWFGKGAERLGLEPSQVVGEEAFLRLCDNCKPLTGEQLTVRQRKVDRRVFHDFVSAPPKSVSIIALVVGDQRIIEAHAASSLVALRQMEQAASTRVRRGGQVQERVTGEIVAAAFQHDASRSLDPQLHTHFVVFNATWDTVERRWKALETRRMFDHLSFFTEVYRAEMARRLQEFGYQIRTTANGFEIEGVSEQLIQRFSKRRHAILAESKRVEQELGKIVSNNGRAAIAHAIRERKLKNLSSAEVRAFQRAQISEAELIVLEGVKASTSGKRKGVLTEVAAVTVAQDGPTVAARTRLRVDAEVGVTSDVRQSAEAVARAAIDFARDHIFERKSVVHRRELLREALKHSRGAAVLPELEAELVRRTEFIVQGDSLAMKSALDVEKQLIAFVNKGIGQCRPLRPGHRPNETLNDEQKAAVVSLLNSPDQIMALRGAAGTGKTEVIREVVASVSRRHEVVSLAPNKSGVEALEVAGLPSCQTVQRFLMNESLKQSLHCPVIVVDEAGLLSNRHMLALAEFVHAKRGRLLLAGDTRQNASVEAGDSLRMMERHSALKTVSLKEIQRQLDLEYRKAIADFAQGQGARAVGRLRQLGAVEILPPEERYQRAAKHYVTSIQGGRSALVVCPTLREVDEVNSEIRTSFQQLGVVGKKESRIIAHRSLKWTQAQTRDFLGYVPGMFLNFHKSTRTFDAGASAEVLRAEPDRLIVRKGRFRKVAITRKQTGCFDVAKPVSITIARGDRLLIQGNRKGAKMINGHLVIVECVKQNGEIRLTNGRTIPRDFRLFTYGHAVTSQAAQGHTVDVAIVVMDKHSLAANEKMLYVGASRGRERIMVLVDDCDTLERALQRSGNRLSVTEMLQAARQRQSEQITARVAAKMKL